MMERPQGTQANLPRLPGRLTSELVLRSPQYMNCIKDYEINLRANRIAVIENLGATQNQFDCIDFTDNNIIKLEGFPRLTRLKMLLCCNNRITKISKRLHEQLPNLQRLIMNNNKIKHLQDLLPLANLKKLEVISLLGNPVTHVKYYRQYLIHTIPTLRLIDFKKVKQQEREEASQLFKDGAFVPQEPAENGAVDEPQDMEEDEENIANGGDTIPLPKDGQLTQEQTTALAAAIQNAETLDEVERLEKALQQGVMPAELMATGLNDQQEEGEGQEELKEEDPKASPPAEDGE